MDTDGAGAPDARDAQVDNAIRAIQQKKPLPEIDFSIHRMEDGTEVNTGERVCKGTCYNSIPPAIRPHYPSMRSTARSLLTSRPL